MDALTLLDRAREAGLTVARDGNRVLVRGPRQAEPIVRLLAQSKAEILTALAEAMSWRARHREAVANWSTLHPMNEAANLAWGEMQVRWHRLHGVRIPEWQCAGCREPIGGLAALGLADGNRVHFDAAHGFDCLLSFGERWRAEAMAGLRVLGLDPPPECEAST
jgi:hypothetical protein